MRNLLTATLCCLLLLLGHLFASRAMAVDWKQHPYDKLTHMAIGGALSCAISAKTSRPVLGVLASLVVGAAKEVHDDRFDRADLLSWGAGGAIGALCWRW